MLGDVRQPQLVSDCCGEVLLHEIVMDQRAGLLASALAGLLPEPPEPAVRRVDAPRGPLGHHLA